MATATERIAAWKAKMEEDQARRKAEREAKAATRKAAVAAVMGSDAEFTAFLVEVTAIMVELGLSEEQIAQVIAALNDQRDIYLTLVDGKPTRATMQAIIKAVTRILSWFKIPVVEG